MIPAVSYSIAKTLYRSAVLPFSICCKFCFSPQKKLPAAYETPLPQQLFFQKTYALSTFPDFKQEVQTYNFFVAPFTLHLTDLMFGLNILLDLLCEWLTLLPKRTLFPQTEHLAIRTPPCMIECFKILNLTFLLYSFRLTTRLF